jgi:hypothetical protein
MNIDKLIQTLLVPLQSNFLMFGALLRRFFRFVAIRLLPLVALYKF